MAHVIQMRKLLHSKPRIQHASTVCIRNFRGPADEDSWLRLQRETIHSEQSKRSWSRADFKREFMGKRWWSPDHMWFAVTETADRLSMLDSQVGTITLGSRGRGQKQRPVVHWLMVSNQWRRKGLGTLLLAHLERRCWRLGHRELRLETLSDWKAAVSFYRARGFQEYESDLEFEEGGRGPCNGSSAS